MPRIAEVLDARPVAFPFAEAAQFIGVGRERLNELIRMGVFTVQRDGTGDTAARFLLADELLLYRGVHRKASRAGDVTADADTRIARLVAYRLKEGRVDEDCRARLKQHGLV